MSRKVVIAYLAMGLVVILAPRDAGRAVFGWQRRRAARRGLGGVRSGSMTAIQRCG
jgi:hypothetical protein